ncbi:MAG: hypothetical protein KGK08_06970 [Acidobacteriota bacterium]|nr:hypothetical protein [Acidobacteriota bacterium]
MTWRRSCVGGLAIAVLLATGLAVAQQGAGSAGDSAAGAGKADAGKSAEKTAAEKPAGGAATQFPYPGDPAPPDASTGGSSGAGQPAAAAPSATGKAADAFPYPGDPGAGSAPDHGSQSPAGSSSDDDALPDPDAVPQSSSRRMLPKVKDLQSPQERAAEDVKVAKFYRDAGNLNAAYLRARDAVKYQPDDAEAHFLLAETALKLNKRDEAVAEFRATLQLDATSKQVKESRRLLQQLGADGQDPAAQSR